MRKLVVTEFMALDGVMEEPAWTFPYWNEEIAKFKGEESSASDALLLGRVTYQGFAAAWPQSKDEGADYFNSVRKYVVSKTLEEPLEWNNSPRWCKRSCNMILWIAIGFLSTRWLWAKASACLKRVSLRL